MTDIDKLIEESKRLSEAATPGPYTISKGLSRCGDPDDYDIDTSTGGLLCETVTHANAEFITHARNALPLLVAEIERLRAAQAPILLHDAPKDGSPVLVETRTGQPLLVHWVHTGGGNGEWVSQGANLTSVSLNRKQCLPIVPWEEIA